MEEKQERKDEIELMRNNGEEHKNEKRNALPLSTSWSVQVYPVTTSGEHVSKRGMYDP